MKRRAEKVSSPDNESREIVRILMSSDLVLMDFKVAELLCEDRFGELAVGRANSVTVWVIEDEKLMKEIKRRVMDEERGRTFDMLIELTRVTGRNCYLLERFKRHEERDENEISSARMDENRGRCLGMRHARRGRCIICILEL